MPDILPDHDYIERGLHTAASLVTLSVANPRCIVVVIPGIANSALDPLWLARVNPLSDKLIPPEAIKNEFHLGIRLIIIPTSYPTHIATVRDLTCISCRVIHRVGTLVAGQTWLQHDRLYIVTQAVLPAQLPPGLLKTVSGRWRDLPNGRRNSLQHTKHVPDHL